jgi:hypothetical protein
LNPRKFDPRCNVQTKSGERCTRRATSSGLCFFHADPDKASELGLIEGMNNHPVAAESTDPLPKLETAAPVQDGPAQLIADVDADKIHPRKTASDGAGQSAKPNHVATISQRKLKANRENARKSTGPKTPSGKASSRRNAIKHGLFVSHRTDFVALDENPQEYEDLLNGLWGQHQPVGKGEEVEVERIALCYWRQKRAWRHENAVSLIARRDFVRRELAEQEEYCQERDKEEEALILQLQSAKKELDDTGEISQELKQRIFALMPGFEALWLALEKAAQERVKELGLSRAFQKLSPQERSVILATYTVTNAIALHEQLGNRRWTNVRETAIGQHAIPNREALDRLLRYETTIDRSLTRALDRLERLQRRRNGERIPPSVSVRLTQ